MYRQLDTTPHRPPSAQTTLPSDPGASTTPSRGVHNTDWTLTNEESPNNENEAAGPAPEPQEPPLRDLDYPPPLRLRRLSSGPQEDQDDQASFDSQRQLEQIQTHTWTLVNLAQPSTQAPGQRNSHGHRDSHHISFLPPVGDRVSLMSKTGVQLPPLQPQLQLHPGVFVTRRLAPDPLQLLGPALCEPAEYRLGIMAPTTAMASSPGRTQAQPSEVGVPGLSNQASSYSLSHNTPALGELSRPAKRQIMADFRAKAARDKAEHETALALASGSARSDGIEEEEEWKSSQGGSGGAVGPRSGGSHIDNAASQPPFQPSPPRSPTTVAQAVQEDDTSLVSTREPVLTQTSQIALPPVAHDEHHREQGQGNAADSRPVVYDKNYGGGGGSGGGDTIGIPIGLDPTVYYIQHDAIPDSGLLLRLLITDPSDFAYVAQFLNTANYTSRDAPAGERVRDGIALFNTTAAFDVPRMQTLVLQRLRSELLVGRLRIDELIHLAGWIWTDETTGIDSSDNAVGELAAEGRALRQLVGIAMAEFMVELTLRGRDQGLRNVINTYWQVLDRFPGIGMHTMDVACRRAMRQARGRAEAEDPGEGEEAG